MNENTNEITSTDLYEKAVKLHCSIVANAQVAQDSLYEVCKGLKEMRDDKLYKGLGFQTFDAYCEDQLAIKKSQAYKYISIAENLAGNFVHSSGQKLGIQRLYLLSTLSENDRQELTERVVVEDVSTRQLKEEIDKLKAESKRAEESAECRIKVLQAQLTDTGNAMRKAAAKAKQLTEKNAELECQIKELESHPIEVVAKDVSAERMVSEALRAEEQKHREELEKLNQKHDEQMNELDRVIKQLRTELETIEDNDQSEELKALEEANRKALSDIESANVSHKAEIETLRKQYEEKMKSIAGGDSRVIFKVYFKNTYDAFNAMLKFVDSLPEIEKTLLQEQVRKLADTVLQSIGGQA